MKHNYTEGQLVGALTYVSESQKTWDGRRVALFRCVCGKMFNARVVNVQNGNTGSCGCKSREATAKAHTKHGEGAHGRTTKLYRAWIAMRNRCYLKSYQHYHRYGGRGITVCDEWRSDFISFRDHLTSLGFKDIPKGCSIDRIDNDVGYRPGNIRVADQVTQVNNSSWCRKYFYAGRMMSIRQVERHIGLNAGTLSARLNTYNETFMEATSRVVRIRGEKKPPMMT